MEINYNIELSWKGFMKWIKTINEGHRRLWLIVSCVWMLVFLTPSAYKYYKDVKRCKSAESDVVSFTSNITTGKTYRGCNIDKTNFFGNNAILKDLGKTKYTYKLSAQYNPLPILWSAFVPLGLPIIIFIIAWIHSGYKNKK